MKVTIRTKGGAGSGDYGHTGRPGKVGGSGGSGHRIYSIPGPSQSELKPLLDKAYADKHAKQHEVFVKTFKYAQDDRGDWIKTNGNRRVRIHDRFGTYQVFTKVPKELAKMESFNGRNAMEEAARYGDEYLNGA